MKKLEIFTDGACKGNPGIGGWGALMRFNGHEKTLKGAEPLTTNNKMELTAAIEALKAIKPTKQAIEIHLTTDSTYVKNGINEWIDVWKNNQWKTKQKKEVKNVELWKILDALCTQHQVHWHWVKGHSGHPGNEMADILANQAIKEYKAEHNL